MDPWMQFVTVFISGLFASSGFWAFLASRRKTQDAWARLLLGLAYDKIATMGMNYIERGWITRDEYEEFRKYLYEPYKEFGGNGVSDQIMLQVQKLPFKSYNRYAVVTGRRNREKQDG